ncbi:class I SAM-dependent DNA methyltransferase [Endothiovibrio diazotrophicus]
MPKKGAAKGSSAHLGFEDRLWAMADKLRGHMDASEYKHVVLGLIFLKYISDAFQALYDDLEKRRESDYTDPEDRDEYIGAGVFWVPEEARWERIRGEAVQPSIGKTLDAAMLAIERENPSLRGVLNKEYGRPTLDKTRLGELVIEIGNIGLGDAEARSKDLLGRVYEYFLGRFAAVEGKGGGEFYTPQSVVRLLVGMLEPTRGRVYDPCCGSGGMFVQSEKFVEEHAGRREDIVVYGQESNPTTWRLARMNLTIRRIDADLGEHNADSFHHDLHKDLKADYILANPPFNMSEWGGRRLADDPRWRYGAPPANNANYAWIQHFLHHLSPTGTAGFVMANGSMSTSTRDELAIRKALVEADLVECMIALPGQLFYTTQIPVCLWFLTRNKRADKVRKRRDRRGETLFIDARRMGSLTTRVHRELSGEEIAEIAGVYHQWRNADGTFEERPGWWRCVSVEEIRDHDFVLTPGRYVGAEVQEEEGVPFEERMRELTTELYAQMDEGAKLDKMIKKNLTELGYGE